MNKILSWTLIIIGLLLLLSALLHISVVFFGANYEGVFLIDHMHDIIHG